MNLTKGAPLIRHLALSAGDGAKEVLLRDVDPVTLITVGRRNLKKRDGWIIFFDKTHLGPRQMHIARRDPGAVAVTSAARRASVSIDGVSASSTC